MAELLTASPADAAARCRRARPRLTT